MSRDDVLQFAVAAAIDAGHDPATVRSWTTGDLLHYVAFKQATKVIDHV